MLYALLMWMFLVSCGPDDATQGGHQAEAVARGKKIQTVRLAWDVLTREGDEAIGSYRLSRGKTCDSLQLLKSDILGTAYEDAPPFQWHQACYQVVAVSVTGALSQPSNTQTDPW